MATIFLGLANGSTVQPVVAIERGAFYRRVSGLSRFKISTAVILRCQTDCLNCMHLNSTAPAQSWQALSTYPCQIRHSAGLDSTSVPYRFAVFVRRCRSLANAFFGSVQALYMLLPGSCQSGVCPPDQQSDQIKIEISFGLALTDTRLTSIPHGLLWNL